MWPVLELMWTATSSNWGYMILITYLGITPVEVSRCLMPAPARGAGCRRHGWGGYFDSSST